MTEEERELEKIAEAKEQEAKEKRKALVHYCPYCGTYYDYGIKYLCRDKKCVKMRYEDRKRPLNLQLKLCKCKSKPIDISGLKHQRATFYCPLCKPEKIKYLFRRRHDE